MNFFELGFIELFVLVVGLLLIEGFFSGSELALLSADRLLLRKKAQDGSRRARVALKLVESPEQVISTTLVFTSFCVVAISSLIGIYFETHSFAHSELLGILATSILVVIFGELLPKTLYQRYSQTLAPRVALPIYVAFYALYPITRSLSFYTTRLTSFMSPLGDLASGKKRTTRDDLRQILTYGRKDIEIQSAEKQMIKRIFDFKDSEAKHALIPLVKVEAIDESTTVETALIAFERHRHSRMPVYGGRIDNIVGVLEVADLLSASNSQEKIKRFVSRAQFVAETQSLEDVLIEMTQRNKEMVIVVDEHGGAIGILTYEDIVEEIVGEINDEFDSETLDVKPVDHHSWVVQARIEIARLNELLPIDLPEGDYETLGGFLLQQFRRIPAQRDDLYYTTPKGDFRFVIRQANERHIETVQIERITPEN